MKTSLYLPIYHSLDDPPISSVRSFDRWFLGRPGPTNSGEEGHVENVLSPNLPKIPLVFHQSLIDPLLHSVIPNHLCPLDPPILYLF